MTDRAKQPSGVTAGLVQQVIFETVPASRIEEANHTKKTLFITKHDGKTRKSDKGALRTNFDTLLGVLKAAGTNVIDKMSLMDGLKMWDAKVGGVCEKSTEMSLADQSYCLKIMLMDIGRTKRNTTTGARLTPWLKTLIQACRQPHDDEDDDDNVTRKRSSTSTTSTSKLAICDGDGEQAPVTPPKRKGSIWKAPTPMTPTSSSAPETTSSPEQTPKKMSNTKNKQYIYDWNDGVGGVRCDMKNPNDYEECKAIEEGDNGFLVCTFQDGEKWESDKPNVTFKDLLDDDDDEPAKKKPAKKNIAPQTRSLPQHLQSPKPRHPRRRTTTRRAPRSTRRTTTRRAPRSTRSR